MSTPKLKKLVKENFPIGGINTANAFGFMIPRSEMQEHHAEKNLPLKTFESSKYRTGMFTIHHRLPKEKEGEAYKIETLSGNTFEVYFGGDGIKKIEPIDINGGDFSEEDALKYFNSKGFSFARATEASIAREDEGIPFDQAQGLGEQNLNKKLTMRADNRILEFAGIKENTHKTLNQSDVENIEVTDVLDIIDPPHVADVAVSFTYQGKPYTGVTQAMNVGGDWSIDDIGNPIEDVRGVETGDPDDSFDPNFGFARRSLYEGTKFKPHPRNLISERAFAMVGGIVPLKPIGGLSTNAPTMKAHINEMSSDLSRHELYNKLPMLHQETLLELNERYTGLATGKNWGNLVEEIANEYFANPQAKLEITAELKNAGIV